MNKLIVFLIFSTQLILGQNLTLEHRLNDITLMTSQGKTSISLNKHLDVSPLHSNPGVPELPAYIYKLALAEGTQVANFHIEKVITVPIPGQFNIPSRQPLWRQDASIEKVEADPQIYKSAQLFPQQAIEYGGTNSFNSQRIAHFLVHPVLYQPDQGRLFLVQSVTISWNEKADGQSVKPLKQADLQASQAFLQSASDATSLKFSPASQTSTITPADLSSGLIDRYVIISPSDFADALSPLAEWKIQKGVPTVVRTLDWIGQEFDGVDLADKMRRFIRWSYENRGTKYVLLVGDLEYTPSRNLTTGGFTFPTDYYFSDLDGSWNADQDGIFGEAVDDLDGYPEVYVSRIPVRSTGDIERFIEKLFKYEKMEDLPAGEEFPSNVLYTAADLSNVDDSYNLIMQHVDPEINPSFKRKMLKQTPDIGSDVNVVLSEYDKNYGIIFTEAHGIAYNYSVGKKGQSNVFGFHMEALKNDFPGLFYIASCYTNDIRKRAISENYMLSSSGGGVAYIGNSSYEYPFSGIYLQQEFFNLVFSRGYFHLAEAHFLSRLIYLGYLNYEGPSRIIVYSTVVLGDPEMPIWTEKPQPMTVSYKDSVNGEQNLFTVQIREELSAQPVPDALVVLYKKNALYKMDYSDKNGLVTFNRNELEADSVFLTVSKHNFIPSQERLDLPPVSGNRLQILQTELSDSSGNNNLLWEPGEFIDLRLQVKNNGSLAFPQNLPANQIHIHNRINYDYVQSVQDTALLNGNIEPGASAWIGPFRYRLDNSAPKDTTLILRTYFEQDSLPLWQLDSPLEIHIPNLLVTDLQADTLLINAPSDEKTSSIFLEVENIGSGAASGTRLAVSCEDTSVHILQVPDLPILFGPNKQLKLSEPVVISYHQELSNIQLQLQLIDQYSRIWEQTINFDPPLAPLDLSFQPYDATGILLNWSASVSTDIMGYHIFRKDESATSFEQITREPVQNAGYFIDEDIEPNQAYSYFIQSVDLSGNLSAQPTDTIPAWGALPFQPGFPRQIGVAGIGAKMNGVTVYDLDGDNRCEIIASGARGNLDVYNTDGSLLFNVTGMSGDLTSPAVGNVFGDEMPEIVVSSQLKATTDNWVFVINGQDGEIIQAFHLDYNLPSSVVLKDLDADGYDEIIVQSFAGQAPVDPKNSRLFIWHSTGNDWTAFSNWPENGYEFNDNYSMGTPAVADLNGDGHFSIIAPTQSHGIYAFQPQDSAGFIWSKSASDLANGGTTGLLTGAVSLADLDLDGNLEILIASSKNDRLYALTAQGDSLAGWGAGLPIEATDPYGRTSPAIIGNLDQDPELEVVYVGRGHVYIFNHDGTSPSGWPVAIQNGDSFYDSGHGVMSPYNSPVLADLNMDGQPEIIFFTAFGLLHALDSKTGKDIIGFPINSGNDFVQGQSAAVNDIDRDGDLDLILIDGEGYLKIWDAPAKYSQNTELYWNQPFANAAHTGELDTTYLTDLSSIEEEPVNTTVNQYALYQNYPNPFNPTTAISYQLPAVSQVRLTVFDVLGQKVETVLEKKQAAGVHTISFEASGLASGIYFYRLQAGDFIQTRKMILLR